MRTLLTDKSLQDKVKQKGQVLARKFTWTACYNKTIEVYQKVTGEQQQ
jgi:glycosyltransferase involved in cell wall biosynthesis